jgi:hypothetical protein
MNIYHLKKRSGEIKAEDKFGLMVREKKQVQECQQTKCRAPSARRNCYYLSQGGAGLRSSPRLTLGWHLCPFQGHGHPI